MSEYPPPDERSGDGAPSGADERPLHHNWFFYVAGFFLVLAMLCFVLSNTLIVHPPSAPLPPSPPVPSPGGGEK